MRISLFIPCFVDQYFPRVGISMVQILEQLGHTVEYPEGQTCCGQPAFNSGYSDEARGTAERLLDIFAGADVVVSASGSCGAMLKVFNPELFANHPRVAEAKDISSKVWEFSDFLVTKLGVEDLGARLEAKATFHDGCHGLRELRIKNQPRRLLKHVRGLELLEMSEAETCCGFGGTFGVKFPHVSQSMGDVKCQSILETGADTVISNDSSCLMQIQGMLNRQNKPVRSLHLAEVLASK